MTDAIRMAKCDKPVFNERVDDSKEDGTHNHFRALSVYTVVARRSSNERTSGLQCVHLIFHMGCEDGQVKNDVADCFDSSLIY